MDRGLRVAISVMVPVMLLMPRLAAAQTGPMATATLPPPLAAAPLPAPPKPAPLPARKPPAPAQHATAPLASFAEARAHALMRKPRPVISGRRQTARETRRPVTAREAARQTGEHRGFAVEGVRRPQIASAWPGAAVPPPWAFYDGPPLPYGPYGRYGPRYRYYPRRWGRGGPWY